MLEAGGNGGYFVRNLIVIDNEKVKSHCRKSCWVYNAVLTIAICENCLNYPLNLCVNPVRREHTPTISLHLTNYSFGSLHQYINLSLSAGAQICLRCKCLWKRQQATKYQKTYATKLKSLIIQNICQDEVDWKSPEMFTSWCISHPALPPYSKILPPHSILPPSAINQLRWSN